MSDPEDIDVAAPRKWMDGWDNLYEQRLKLSDEELTDIEANPPIQQLMHALGITSTDPEDLDILELACGDGEYACYLGRLGSRVIGIEALASAVKVARKRAQIMELKDQVEFHIGDIDQYPLKSEAYDIVIALQCLQYLFDRATPRLREIMDAVKPGGFLVYSGNILPHKETDPPIRFITEDEIKSELEGWTLHSVGKVDAIFRPGDLRGYLWVVARKPS
ncbi:MAG: class I SAM-dependent methyltransferase [Candidatus Thorarchaeota archaeon]|jgi:SAM-dependent methyltransferase